MVEKSLSTSLSSQNWAFWAIAVLDATLTSVMKRKVWLQPAGRHRGSFSEAVGLVGGGWRVGSQPLTQHTGSQPRTVYRFCLLRTRTARTLYLYPLSAFLTR